MLAFSALFIPLFLLLVLVVLFLALFILGRVAGGRYLRATMQFLMKVPLLGKGLQRMSRAALERQNPELASAVKKLERLNANASPQRAQAALSQLSSEERRAYMDAVQEQGAMPEATNRAMRRQMKKQQRRR